MSIFDLKTIDGTALLTVSDTGVLSCYNVATDVTGSCTGTSGGLTSSAVYRSPSDVTATGSAQNIAHGLGATPSDVSIQVMAGHDGAGGAGTQVPTIVEGTHTSTNIIFTVSAGAKFRVRAIKGGG